MKTLARACIGVLVLAAAVVAATRLHRDPAPALLVMQPSSVPVCTTPVATRVEWDVRALGQAEVKLEVANLGRPPKLWVHAGQTGQAEAGAWAHDGYTVTLKTPDGRVLAKRTLTTRPCNP